MRAEQARTNSSSKVQLLYFSASTRTGICTICSGKLSYVSCHFYTRSLVVLPSSRVIIRTRYLVGVQYKTGTWFNLWLQHRNTTAASARRCKYDVYNNNNAVVFYYECILYNHKFSSTSTRTQPRLKRHRRSFPLPRLDYTVILKPVLPSLFPKKSNTQQQYVAQLYEYSSTPLRAAPYRALRKRGVRGARKTINKGPQ